MRRKEVHSGPHRFRGTKHVQETGTWNIMKAESGTPVMREVAGRGLAGLGEECVCVCV